MTWSVCAHARMGACAQCWSWHSLSSCLLNGSLEHNQSRWNLKYFLWVHIYVEAYRALLLGQGSNALCWLLYDTHNQSLFSVIDYTTIWAYLFMSGNVKRITKKACLMWRYRWIIGKMCWTFQKFRTCQTKTWCLRMFRHSSVACLQNTKPWIRKSKEKRTRWS